MSNIVHLSHSEQETRDIGRTIASTLHGGSIVALHGELGAGKTTLVKGIAEGLGVAEDITSPTFTLMNTYNLKPKTYNLKQLVHIDTYRLKNEQELINIGAEDYIGAPDTVCVIEWPEKLPNLLREKTVKDISLEHVDEKTRRITIL